MRYTGSVCLLLYLFLIEYNLLTVDARVVDNTSYDQTEKLPFVHPKFHQEDDTDKSVLSFFTGSFIEKDPLSAEIHGDVVTLDKELKKGFDSLKDVGEATYTELPESEKDFDQVTLQFKEHLDKLKKYADRIKTLEVTRPDLQFDAKTLPEDTTHNREDHIAVGEGVLDQLKFREVIFTKEGPYLIGRLYKKDEDKFLQPSIVNAESTLKHFEDEL